MGNCDSDTSDYDEEAARAGRRRVFDAKVRCSLLRMELAEKQKKAEENEAMEEKLKSLDLKNKEGIEECKRLWATLRAPMRARLRAEHGDLFGKEWE